MTDAECAEDSINMIMNLKFLETLLTHAEKQIPFDREKYMQQLRQMTEQDIGRELLNRNFGRIFLDGGPKGMNSRIRKSLIKLMVKINKEHPELRGEDFEMFFMKLIEKDVA